MNLSPGKTVEYADLMWTVEEVNHLGARLRNEDDAADVRFIPRAQWSSVIQVFDEGLGLPPPPPDKRLPPPKPAPKKPFTDNSLRNLIGRRKELHGQEAYVRACRKGLSKRHAQKP